MLRAAVGAELRLAVAGRRRIQARPVAVPQSLGELGEGKGATGVVLGRCGGEFVELWSGSIFALLRFFFGPN